MIKLKDILINLREDIIESDNVISTLESALIPIRKLGNKTLLCRESGGIRSGAAKVVSGPWDKGKIGMVINPKSPTYNQQIGELFQKLVAKFGINHIVYASHDDSRHGLFGRSYYMIPVGEYKTVWSPKVNDIYADASNLQKADNLKTFPLDSYQTTWPTGKVSEVLVDCTEYYLVSLKIPIVKDYMEYSAYKSKAKVVNPTTYSELADLIDGTLKYFKR